MTTINTSALLREFPKIRRAALAGETVIIETREGRLRLTADYPEDSRLLGAMLGEVKEYGDLTEPTTGQGEW